MKKYLATKTALISVLAGLAAIFAFPVLSFASNYTVSPQVLGYTVVSVQQAAVICQSLPDSVAAQMTFCSYSYGGGYSAAPTMSNIYVSGINLNSATISWTTDQPTLTMFWYANPATPTLLVGYANPSQGYTTSHSITVNGINTDSGYGYIVGGVTAGGAFGYSPRQSF